MKKVTTIFLDRNDLTDINLPFQDVTVNSFHLSDEEISEADVITFTDTDGWNVDLKPNK